MSDINPHIVLISICTSKEVYCLLFPLDGAVKSTNGPISGSNSDNT